MKWALSLVFGIVAPIPNSICAQQKIIDANTHKYEEVKFESIPGGARVEINGSVICNTPCPS